MKLSSNFAIFSVFLLCATTSLISSSFAQTINNELKGELNFDPDRHGPSRVLTSEYGELQLEYGQQILKTGDQRFIHVSYRKRPFEMLNILGVDSLILPDSTYFIVFGIGDFVQERDLMRNELKYPFLSFEIMNMPPIGDTATFEFCFLAKKFVYDYPFQPELYFSTTLVKSIHRNLPVGFEKYISMGNLPMIPKESYLYHGLFKTVVTEELSACHWLHLRMPSTGDINYGFVRGAILPFSILELNERWIKLQSQQSTTLTVEFDLGSTKLPKTDKGLIKAWIASKNTTAIVIRSQISRSGNMEFERFLNNLRAQQLRDYLLELGSPLAIRIQNPIYSDDSAEDVNRKITIEIVE